MAKQDAAPVAGTAVQDRIAALTAETRRQAQELADLASLLDRAEARCAALEHDLAAAREIPEETGTAQAPEEYRRALSSLRRRVAELNAESDGQAQDLARLARLVFDKEEALKRRNAAAHEAGQAAAAARRDLLAVQEAEAACARRLAEAEARIEALLHSSSWRITAPLRGLARLWKR